MTKNKKHLLLLGLFFSLITSNTFAAASSTFKGYIYANKVDAIELNREITGSVKITIVFSGTTIDGTNNIGTFVVDMYMSNTPTYLEHQCVEFMRQSQLTPAKAENRYGVELFGKPSYNATTQRYELRNIHHCSLRAG